MSNQAFSQAADLMVGAGEFYFQRDDDVNGFHHLGNVDEFIPKVQRELGLGIRAEILAILSDGDESMNINNIQQRIVLEIEWYK